MAKRIVKQHNGSTSKNDIKQNENIIIDGDGLENSLISRSHGHLNAECEKPISYAYSTIDNDLARDNLENDMTFADLQDL